ncbi:MAG: S9 family peptidase, partial [Bacteroidota bacterium]
MRLLAALLAIALVLPAAAQDDLTYQTPAPELAALVDAPRTPLVSLSPDKATMALLERRGAPSVAEIAQPEIGLGGSRVNPRTNGPSRTRGYVGVSLQAVAGGEARAVTGLPPEATFRSAQWSPDGQRLAMLTDFPDRIELWTVDVATAQARRVLDAPVNDAAPGASFDWLPTSDALVVRTVPAGRAPLAQEADVPTGPVVQQSDGQAAPARTYQDLLASPDDEALFDHYMTGRLVVAGLDGSTRTLGPDAVYTSMSVSPDGQYLLTQARHRPYSYLVPWYRFPNRVEVWDVASGEKVHEVADLPLAERVPIAFGSVPTGPRSFAWRADAPATLYWTEAQDGGDASAPAEVRDQVYTHAAPFSGSPEALVTLPLRYGGITWGDEDTAIVEESMWQDRTRRAYVFDPSETNAKRELFTVSFEDRYNDPGRPMTEATPSGTRVLKLDGDTSFWSGQGASAEGNRPFVVTRDMSTGGTTELFRSAAP